jgi:hypothetical protein
MGSLNYGVSSHDKFRVLCAISTSDSLTGEERRTLDEHLAVCEECRQLAAEYEALARSAIPTLIRDFPEDSFVPPEWSGKEAKLEFFRRLDRRQELLTARTPGKKKEHKRLEWKLWPLTSHRLLPYATALATVLAVGTVGYRLGSRQVTGWRPAGTLASMSLVQVATPDSAELALLHAQLEERGRSIASLNSRIDHQIAELQQLKMQDQKLRDSIESEQGHNAQAISERDDLNRQLAQAQSELAGMQKDLDSLHQQRAAQALHVADLEAQGEKIPGLLKDRDTTIAQQRELLDRDRDIRDLMGARDLYIAEVMDVGRDGETKKPFGRVFYTKGKSLIFYAYDLDQQPNLREASTFQAWGRRGPDLSQATDLGIFYADNSAHKRWVLKFNDVKSLEQIDAVFVTVEPKGGSRKPSGKQLLFAYLRVEPNHP